MPDSAPAPVAESPLRKVARRLLLAALLIGAGFAVMTCLGNMRKRDRAFLEHLYQEHGGRIAWVSDADKICWTEFTSGGATHRFKPATTPLRVAWSSSGDQLFAILESGTFDHVHQIVAINPLDNSLRVLLDLGLTPLEDNDVDEDQFWVAPYGDAEAEVDRIYFKVGRNNWYSVEGKRSRVRPEAGPPPHRWDQSRCPDGRHRLVKKSDDDDTWLELTDGDASVKITSDSPHGPAAWWCAR